MTDLNEIKRYLQSYDGTEKIIMEVCGTHTASISENGIPDMLSNKIKLISGPGCPVCVTVASYIDKLIKLSKEANTTVATFGDMLRVRGSNQSLSEAAAEGASVKMVYSPLEIISMAKENSNRQFVFAAVGFETTTPVYALMIEQLIKQNIKNVRLLTALKTMPEAIRYVARGTKITGFLAPGHVSAITGHKLFEDMAKELKIPFVTAGFKGEELISAIYALTRLSGGQSLNMYPSVVSREGNMTAKALVDKYFCPCSAAWRGMGIIENSGMRLRGEYARYDAGSEQCINDSAQESGCRCGEVISGKISPHNCPLFGGACTPDNPRGACMVSTEGSCFHYYVNNRR